MSTYRAVHVVSKGKLELVEKPLLDPPAGHVRIRVEACGVCHSDAITVDGLLPIQYPRVPGHEAVGKIDVIGQGVEGWSVGQRVGVGFLGGSCGHCEYCRDGDLVNCTNQAFTGVQHDGGYAEMIDREGERIDVRAGRVVIGRRSAAAVCRYHDVQCPAEFSGTRGRLGRDIRGRRPRPPWRAIRATYGI